MLLAGIVAPLTLRDGLRRKEGFVRALYGTAEAVP
jgi:hypothetical protein